MLNFLDIPEKYANYEGARVVVLPVPYEASTTYGKGTSLGPKAIIQAASQVEYYDEELECESLEMGIATRPALDFSNLGPEASFKKIHQAVAEIVRDGKFPVILGGEHAVTFSAVEAVGQIKRDLTVVQLDAHADLRQEYQNSAFNHACVMARIREHWPAVQLGIRELSQEEATWIKQDRLPVFFAHQMQADNCWEEKALSAIKTEQVYCTIDVDVFDSSVLAETGTPSPGGLNWCQITSFLKRLYRERKVVGLDLVELAPQAGRHAADFLVAKLAYRCLGYWWKGK